ncbi:MAG: hypothetical protein R3252_13495, partial [Robiginitalea sp.]|nr:hypothetical protein [Robiginitalea sp.]
EIPVLRGSPNAKIPGKGTPVQGPAQTTAKLGCQNGCTRGGMGSYVWGTGASPKEFRNSELAGGISEAFELVEAPDIELMDILFKPGE